MTAADPGPAVKVFGTLLAGGVAALDATAVGQTLLAQPLVTATFLGALWGDWTTALEVGMILQLLAAGTLPLGSRTPEDYATGGVIGVGLAVALATRHPFEMYRESCAVIGAIVGMVSATAGIPVLKWQRRVNEGLGRWCEERLRAGDEGALSAAHRAAIVLAFAAGVGWCAVWLALGGWGLARVVEGESLRLSRAWGLAQPLWLGLGLAQLLNVFLRRRLGRAALFAISLVGTWLVLMLRTP
ncbi:MAG: PTS sugar transporter subunit IIC [Candidatus Eisenbacteria bacterium]|nr:PTS sugar transporter subunit IIC [Candidatus Eisenbacteria bacterium]